MDKPISVGDLVQVFRPKLCCGNGGDGIGQIFSVAKLFERASSCPFCGRSTRGVHAYAITHDRGYLVGRLKRIPPLEELEGEKRDETVSA